MNAYNFDLHIIAYGPNNLSLSIELQYTMVDCLSYFIECLSSYFLFDFHLEKQFSCIYDITRPNYCIWW